MKISDSVETGCFGELCEYRDSGDSGETCESGDSCIWWFWQSDISDESCDSGNTHKKSTR